MKRYVLDCYFWKLHLKPKEKIGDIQFFFVLNTGTQLEFLAAVNPVILHYQW